MQRLLNCTLSLWAGSLITVCAVVAPGLFNLLSDRHQAGEIAGYFFRLQSWIGLALGSVTLLLLARSAANARKTVDYILAVTAMIAPLLSQWGLRSSMDGARAAGDMQRFGLLHAVSAGLFGIACVCVLALLWRLSAPAAR